MTNFNPDHIYIIAEAGVNHNGQKELAFSLIDVAANAGADAVKFQTFDAKKLASKSAPKADYQKKSTDAEESQLAMLQQLELPREWHAELQAHAHKKGVDFLSTAFDIDSLEFLDTLDMPLYKVPSGELTNAPLLWRFARTGKPLVLSTGMAVLAEVEEALAVVAHAMQTSTEPNGIEDVWKCWSVAKNRQRLQQHVALLHCTSQYPTPPHEVNLLAMDTLASAFGLTVGYSDHTDGKVVPVIAAARGARIIEKHFTLDRTMPGPDHKASLEPDELGAMVSEIRAVEQALGDGSKAPQSSEWNTRSAARQQVIAVRDISKGTVFTRKDLSTARCGKGLPARMLWELVGQKADRNYSAGEALKA